MAMRLSQLVEGDDGRLDEQPVLMIMLGLTLAGLTIFTVVVRGAAFDETTFATACGIFMGGACGSLTLRSRLSQRNFTDADHPDQPAQ